MAMAVPDWLKLSQGLAYLLDHAQQHRPEQGLPEARTMVPQRLHSHLALAAHRASLAWDTLDALPSDAAELYTSLYGRDAPERLSGERYGFAQAFYDPALDSFCETMQYDSTGACMVDGPQTVDDLLDHGRLMAKIGVPHPDHRFLCLRVGVTPVAEHVLDAGGSAEDIRAALASSTRYGLMSVMSSLYGIAAGRATGLASTLYALDAEDLAGDPAHIEDALVVEAERMDRRVAVYTQMGDAAGSEQRGAATTPSIQYLRRCVGLLREYPASDIVRGLWGVDGDTVALAHTAARMPFPDFAKRLQEVIL